MSDTLTNLIARTRQRADMVSTQRVTDAEVTSYLNAAASEMYAGLVVTNQDWFTPDPVSVTIASGNTFTVSTALSPAKMSRLRGIDFSIGSGWVSVPPFRFADRDFYQFNVPSVAGTYRVWYTPEMTKLSSGSDQLHTAIPQDLEEFVVVCAASKIKDKNEEDASVLLNELARLQRRVDSYAVTRGQPKSVSLDEGDRNDSGRVYRLVGDKVYIYALGTGIYA